LTTFQLITLPIVVAMIVATAVAVARRALSLRYGVLFILVWLGAAIGIADPDVLSKVATFLGIGRGVDLVLYLSILAFFIAFFLVYLRFRRLDEQMTEIVRHLAIREGERKAGEEKG
jgi:hypothetical protein